jgi:ATP-dependent Clp protease ATP-binding subunit ClpA
MFMSYKNNYQKPNYKKSIQTLENNLSSSVFGQEYAIKEIVNKIMISESGLGDANKPIASFLFTGPTGVGKTELAIELAKNLNLHFERFDMSEYSAKSSASTLIGAASGLVGHDQGGVLTNAIKKNPHCVLLLDEIEKADNTILNTFLQILDYGVLTNSKGEKVDFTQVIIIMTSNLGATAKSSMGFSSNSKINKDDEINEFLSPELRARIDCKIEFNPLSKEMTQSITNKFLDQLLSKLNQQSKTMNITQEALQEINTQAYNSKLGARYISKIINETIKQRLAYELLFGEFKEKSIVTIDFKDDFTYIFENFKEFNPSNSDEIFFNTALEAQLYAKSNPHVAITRCNDRDGFTLKK